MFVSDVLKKLRVIVIVESWAGSLFLSSALNNKKVEIPKSNCVAGIAK